MNLRAFFRKHPVLHGAAAFVASVTASGLMRLLLTGEFKFDNWGMSAVLAVFVATQARRWPVSQ